MTDLEITKLCAEAMGYQPLEPVSEPALLVDDGWKRYAYEPLIDDAQAMALVKKLRMIIGWRLEEQWMAGDCLNRSFDVYGQDLNRAICECVAKMQAAKASAPSAAV